MDLEECDYPEKPIKDLVSLGTMANDTNSQNTIIETALIFYRQHLIKELQKFEIDFSRIESLPFAREDVERQNTYHRQLQNVCAILESRRQHQENLPMQPKDPLAYIEPSYGAVREKDIGLEPQISLSSSQQVSSGSNSTSPSSRPPPMPSNIKAGGQSHPEGSQISSQPISPQVNPARRNVVPSPPETFLPFNPSNAQSESVTRTGLQRNDLAAITNGLGSSNFPLSSQCSPILETYNANDGHHTLMSKSAAENIMPGSAPAINMRSETLLQPTAWNNVMSASEGMISSTSSSRENGPDDPRNLGPPFSVSKRGSPASSVTSHERRHISTPSASTDELVDRPSSVTASYPQEPLSPPPPPPQHPPAPEETIRLRPRPSFKVLDSSSTISSFGNGMKPILESQEEMKSRSQVHGRLPSGDGIPPAPSHRKQRKPLNTTATSNLTGQRGGQNISVSPAPPIQSKGIVENPSPRSSFDTDNFSLPIFSNEAQTADEYLRKSVTDEKLKPGPVGQHRQHAFQSSFSSRSASDSRVLNQHQSVNDKPRTFSSQPSLSASPNNLSTSPFQSKPPFNAKPEFLSPSVKVAVAGSSPRTPIAVIPNQLTSTRPELNDISPPQHYGFSVEAFRKPEKLAPPVTKDYNGISPNQLKPRGLHPGQTIDLGQKPTTRVSQDRIVIRLSDHQGSTSVNQINLKGEKSLKAPDSHPRKRNTDSRSRAQENVASNHPASNLYEEQRLAQFVADLAERDEMARLKRLQDDWNREEDILEANLYSMIQKREDDFSTYETTSNSVQFAGPSKSRKPANNIVVRPLQSIPAQKRQTDTRQVSTETKGKDNAINDSECTVCRDTLTSPAETATLPCNHTYHPSCLASGFQHALAAGKLFICCDALPAPIDTVASILPPQFVTKYKAKIVERSTPNPIYCAKPGCAVFIPPENITGPLANCAECGFVTCKMCRNPEHKGVCPPDKDGGMLMTLAGNKNWCQCQRCKSMVERDEGCLHMTCSCGHEFCYNCGGVWTTCGGSCPRKS